LVLCSEEHGYNRGGQRGVLMAEGRTQGRTPQEIAALVRVGVLVRDRGVPYAEPK